MLHIWHEDSQDSSTQQFWELLKRSGVDDRLKTAEIRAFGGYTNLCNYVEHTSFNTGDKYIIFMDCVTDNPAVIKYYKKLKHYVKDINNIYLSDLLCFEYLMLSFKNLESWTKPKFINKQYNYTISIIDAFKKCIDNGVAWITDTNIREYATKVLSAKDISDLANISSEKIASSLLLMLTYKSPFRIDKTTLGSCWTSNCCNVDTGKIMCNIYRYKKTSLDKARNLWNCTPAHSIICKHS